MKILITGAGGFIGKHLVKQLDNQHQLLKIISKQEQSKSKLDHCIDLLDENALKKSLDK